MNFSVVWQLENGSTYEAYKTVDRIAAARPERFVITGDDPLARKDIGEIVEYARRRGLVPAVHLNPTQNVTAASINQLQRNGARRLIVSIDSASPENLALRALRWGRDAGLALEVDTLLTSENVPELGAIAEMIDVFHIEAWNVSFAIRDGVSSGKSEETFGALAAIASLAKYRIRILEAPQYGRYLVQHEWPDFSGYVGNADVVDETLYITADGEVHPSEFLPLSGGNLRDLTLREIVRSSDLFVSLRDRRNLTGKCRNCDYRKTCGGSRARAWAATGDLFASDPLCAYQPEAV